MRSANGRLVVQPGTNPILHQFTGWKRLLLWASVTQETTDPFPAEQPVRFTCARESGGTKNSAAVGRLIAGPTSILPAAQVLTVSDYADLLVARAFLRSDAVNPVRIEWVAWEPDAAPRAAVADAGNFLPIGMPGSAASHRVDAWGRQLVTAAPPAQTFSLWYNHTGGPYSAPLISAATLGAMGVGGGLAGGNDKLAGWIALTELRARLGPEEDLQITALPVPAGHGSYLTSAGTDGIVERSWHTPPLFYFSVATGTFPQLVSPDLFAANIHGHLIFTPSSTESDP